MANDGDTHPVAFCRRHGKDAYGSRKAARARAKMLKNLGKMNAFRCDGTPGWWHFGHLPDIVKQGHRRLHKYNICIQ